MKECELCNSPARMYCESDQASLCWECDSKVHSANFLVARHSRSLLCHVCQSATPWQASGSKLGPTVNVCERCVKRCSHLRNQQGEEQSSEINDEDDEDEEDDEDQEDQEDESDDDDDDDGDENDGESGDIDNDDDEGDNQVVPWSSSTPPPPIATSSSSEDSSTRFYRNRSGVNESEPVFSLKRTRQDDFILSSSSSQTVNIEDSSVDSDRHRVDRKRSLSTQSSNKPAAIVNSIKRFEQQLISGNEASILEMCRLHNDPRRNM